MEKRNSAYLQVTRKCNNACVFCSNPVFEKELQIEQLFEEILKLKKTGVNEIVLTGGEPTTYKKLFEVVNFILNENLKFRIISNGVNFDDKEFVQKLYDLGLNHVHISVHHYLEDKSDELSKVSGHFVKTIRGIRNLIDLGIRVDINSTINSLNSNCLLDFVKFMTYKFPEIKHYVFNNLDPGNSDGVHQSRAGKNPWIIAKFSDIEFELFKMVEFLKENNKTFRIERVPLCFMRGFEEFSTETRKIVKDEVYRCSFVQKGTEDNVIRTVNPGFDRIKSDICNLCKLNEICVGVQKEYINIYDNKELSPSFENLEKIKEKILKN